MSGETVAEWSAHGLECCVIDVRGSHLCGYAQVPESHPWHGKGCSEKVDGPPNWEEGRSVDDAGMGGMVSALSGSLGDWGETIEGRVAVHGGITFAGSLDNGGWWFGFDCAHAGDAFCGMSGHRWTVDEVKAETERMAEQLAAVAA